MQAVYSSGVPRSGHRHRRKSIDSLGSYLQEIGKISLLTAEDEVKLGRQVQAMMSHLAAKKRLGKSLGYEPSDVEWAMELKMSPAALSQVLTAGERAKQRMIEANLRLVVSIAKKYQHRGLDFVDLIQEGTTGLNRAVEKFDPSRGYKFSTYASWWIRQGVTRGIAQSSRVIRLPIHVSDSLNRIRRSQQTLSLTLGRNPKLAEVAEDVGLKPEVIKRYLSAAHQPVSLNSKAGPSQELELLELLPDVTELPERTIEQQQLKQALHQLLERLPNKQREVIELRYGLDNGKAQSLAEVGEQLGISRERVRQLQVLALSQLKRRSQMVQEYREML